MWSICRPLCLFAGQIPRHNTHKNTHIQARNTVEGAPEGR